MAKDLAQADQDLEWEIKTKKMLQTVREKALKRRLTAISQGTPHSVQSISMSISKWFHSREEKELHKFNEGVFEAHPMADNNGYWGQFTYKVPHNNYKEVILSETPGSRWW